MVQSEHVSLLPGGAYVAAPSRKTKAARVAAVAAFATVVLAGVAVVSLWNQGSSPSELYAAPQTVQEFVVERAANGAEYLEPLAQGPQLAEIPQQQAPQQALQYQQVDTVAPVQQMAPEQLAPAQGSVYPQQLPSQLKAQKPSQAIELQQALASAEEHTEKYAQQIDELQGKVDHWDRAAKSALAQIKKVKKFQHWATVESNAAKSLHLVQQTAQQRLSRQQAISNALRPTVELQVEKRRILDDRAAQAQQAAASKAAYLRNLNYQLTQGKASAQQQAQRTQLTSLSAKAMASRAEKMEMQAKQDDKQAVADIQLARASVLGARKNADKTLATLRASMHPVKGKKVNAVAEAAAEASFAAKAHQATLTMNSKKVEAKKLRQEASRLRANAKELQMVADERRRGVPAAKAQAMAAQQRVKQLQLQLRQAQATTGPTNVQGALDLARAADNDSNTAVAELSNSENKLAKAEAFFAKARKSASKEARKARQDATVAEGHMAAAHKMYARALSHKKRYETRLKSLNEVLSSAKTELASLKSEAAQALASPQVAEE